MDFKNIAIKGFFVIGLIVLLYFLYSFFSKKIADKKKEEEEGESTCKETVSSAEWLLIKEQKANDISSRELIRYSTAPHPMDYINKWKIKAVASGVSPDAWEVIEYGASNDAELEMIADGYCKKMI